MKAIQTRYLGPTNTRGSRIKAWVEGGSSVIVSYDHGAHDPHAVAAQALLDKMNWNGELVSGGLPNGDCAWVFVNGSDRIRR